MKNALLVLSFLIVSISYSQTHTFQITNQILSTGGDVKNINSGNPQLKIINFTGGKYYVGVKDNSTGYFISATVKFSHIEEDIYIYSITRFDAELRNLHTVASDTKLSDMAEGVDGDVILHFNDKNYWFLSTK